MSKFAKKRTLSHFADTVTKVEDVDHYCTVSFLKTIKGCPPMFVKTHKRDISDAEIINTILVLPPQCIILMLQISPNICKKKERKGT